MYFIGWSLPPVAEPSLTDRNLETKRRWPQRLGPLLPETVHIFPVPLWRTQKYSIYYASMETLLSGRSDKMQAPLESPYDDVSVPLLNFQIKYNLSPNKVWFPSKSSINKVWLTYKYFSKILIFEWKSINLEWQSLKYTCIVYVSAEGMSKIFLGLLIGR